MAQEIKVTAAKPSNLSSISRTHTLEENQLFLTPQVCYDMCTPTDILKMEFKESFKQI